MKARAMFLALLFAAHTAHAEAMAYIPAWTRTKDLACYDFEQAKQLVVLDQKLQLCSAEEAGFASITKDLKLANDQLILALTDANANLKLVQKDNDDLVAQAKTQNEALAKAQSTRSIGFGWAVAGALALILGGVLLENRLRR